MKNKGFTLIELLAVIIIIGLIAVITIPKINDSVETSKKNLAKTNALNYSKSIQKQLLEEQINKNIIKLDGNYNINENGNLEKNNIELNLDYSGEKPKNGYLTYNNDELQSACITFDKYAVTIENEEATLVEKGDCTEIIEAKTIVGSKTNTYLKAVLEFYSENDLNTLLNNSTRSISTFGSQNTVYNVLKTVQQITTDGVEKPEGLSNNGWISINYIVHAGETEIKIVDYSLNFGDYTANYLSIENGEFISKAKKGKEEPAGLLANDGAKYLTTAKEVYYNPSTGKICSDYNEENSETGTITGCMRWYLYSTKGNYANMLLDHNITEAGAENGKWATSTDYIAGLTEITGGTGYQIIEGTGSKAISAGITYSNTIEKFPPYGDRDFEGQSKTKRGPVTALNTLKSLTSNWKTNKPLVPNNANTNEYIHKESGYQIDYTEYHARLITKYEEQYIGCGGAANTCPTWMSKGTQGENPETYESINGYWTSDSKDGVNIYTINYQNKIGQGEADQNTYGIRPVITVRIKDVM